MQDESVKYTIYDDSGISPTQDSVDEKISNVENNNTNFQNEQKTGISTSEPLNPEKLAQMIESYVSSVSPKIWVLTPCYGGMCHVNYIKSMIATMDAFMRVGIKFHFEFCKNDSLITRARNNMIAKAMSDPEMTHMIFIDNDITWKPLDLIRMMVSDKEILGGIYPIKNYDWTRMVKDPMNPYNSNIVRQWLDCKEKSELGKFISDEQMIQSNLLRYNVNYLSPNLQIVDNLTRVRHIPTGFMMIQRSVILKMQEQMIDKKYVDDVGYLTDAENANAYALFDCGVIEGHYFSEDWYFCEKWLKMGGEIWADVSVNLTHTGMEDFQGSYIASLMTM